MSKTHKLTSIKQRIQELETALAKMQKKEVESDKLLTQVEILKSQLPMKFTTLITIALTCENF